MAELEACPKCGEKTSVTTWHERPGPRINDEYFVRCSKCSKTGPIRNDIDAAEDAWNALPRVDYVALAKALATVLVGMVDPCEGCPLRCQPDDLCELKQHWDTAIAAAKEAGVIA